MNQIGNCIGVFVPLWENDNRILYIVHWNGYNWQNRYCSRYFAIGQVTENIFYPEMWFHDLMETPEVAKQFYLTE